MADMSTLPRILAVDFDGTLCEDCFPNIGEPIPATVGLVKAYQRVGWKIVLWTCRNGDALVEAVAWCKQHGLTFDAVNTNIQEVQDLFGGDTRKVYADRYLDDKAILFTTAP